MRRALAALSGLCVFVVVLFSLHTPYESAHAGPGGFPTGPVNASMLRGLPIAATPPAAGQGMAFNGTQWAPATLAGGSVTSIGIGAGLTSTQTPLTTAGTLSVTERLPTHTAAGKLVYDTGAAYAETGAGTAHQLLHGAAGAPVWGAVDLTNEVGVSLLPAGSGGTGLNTSVASGVPVITAGGWAINAQVPVAAGGTNASAIGTLGAVAYAAATSYGFSNAPASATVVLHGNAAGAPTWSAINLATDVTGALPTSALSGTISQAQLAGLPAGALPFVDLTAVAVLPGACLAVSTFTTTNPLTTANITTRWVGVGVGAGNVVVQVYDITAAAETCHCTAGACTLATTGTAPLVCTCASTIPAGHTVCVRVSSSTNCAVSTPVTISGTVELRQ